MVPNKGIFDKEGGYFEKVVDISLNINKVEEFLIVFFRVKVTFFTINHVFTSPLPF